MISGAATQNCSCYCFENILRSNFLVLVSKVVFVKKKIINQISWLKKIMFIEENSISVKCTTINH